jgi:hypothetical protein
MGAEWALHVAADGAQQSLDAIECLVAQAPRIAGLKQA